MLTDLKWLIYFYSLMILIAISFAAYEAVFKKENKSDNAEDEDLWWWSIK